MDSSAGGCEGGRSDQVVVNPDGVRGVKQVAQYAMDGDFWPIITYRNITVNAINAEIRRRMGATSLDSLFPGLKLVCTANNYAVNVVNGSLMEVDYVIEGGNDGERGGTAVMTDGRVLEVSFDRNDRGRKIVNVEDGFAITCHKAQGSEWPRICVVEDIPCAPDWRYTAATRAMKDVVYFTRRVL